MALQIDEFISRAEITEVLNRYCRAVDRGDIPSLKAVYHPGATEHHGGFNGVSEDFAEYIVEKMDAAVLHGQHHITNVLFEFDGDRARVESYFLAIQPYTAASGENLLGFIGGRYLDIFERRDGSWLIADRTVVMDWSRESLPGSEWPGHVNYPRPARRLDDPSSGFFAEIA
ncbi:nuclear transport factor 2 family protein [Microbacterium sp. zg.B48]|uniref:nuclear transport factor 2 family protein n=1 Tax=Microbacterium sp. zg.B48 TaxID=2969408 RepID=UPI00214AB341|nr:nuclear transport factor 2 family protein [Microbacterium sp. zg.B48]MCR2764334.1 nuclear transport factor 2 family protein [Microbacterium sp. zg.B48]